MNTQAQETVDTHARTLLCSHPPDALYALYTRTMYYSPAAKYSAADAKVDSCSSAGSCGMVMACRSTTQK